MYGQVILPYITTEIPSDVNIENYQPFSDTACRKMARQHRGTHTHELSSSTRSLCFLCMNRRTFTPVSLTLALLSFRFRPPTRRQMTHSRSQCDQPSGTAKQLCTSPTHKLLMFDSITRHLNSPCAGCARACPDHHCLGLTKDERED